MLVVGLTGGIASGKSTVAQRFKELGATVVDADIIARQVVLPGTEGLETIVSHFGKEVMLPDGNLDRKKLGAIIFADKSQRELLNKILHPRIINYSKELINNYKEKPNSPLLIYEAALLLEVGMQDLFDEIWVVYSEQEFQIKRLIERDTITVEQAMEKLAAQMSGKERIKYADRVIDTSGDLTSVFIQIDNIWKEIMNE